MRNSVSCRSYHCCSCRIYRIRRKSSKLDNSKWELHAGALARKKEERYIDRYILLFSCTCARVQFSFVVVQLMKKLGSTINFFFVGFFVPIWKEHVVWVFFRKKHQPCNTNLQWRIIWLILGMRKTAREAAELCGVTELIVQMSWNLKQLAKHFYWRSVLKNALSSKLTRKHLWPRVYSVFSETLPYRPWFYTKKGETLIYMTRSSWLW